MKLLNQELVFVIHGYGSVGIRCPVSPVFFSALASYELERSPGCLPVRIGTTLTCSGHDRYWLCGNLSRV